MHHILPIRYDNYWFITQYLGLYILSPYLTKALTRLSRKEYKSFLVSFFIIVSILQLNGLKGGFSLVWFMFLYAFAGYLKTFPKDYFFLQNNSGLIFIFGSFLLFIISIFTNSGKLGIVTYWGFYNGPILFLTSVSLFLFFLKKRESQQIIAISRIAPYTLGIYLFHEHPILKEVLWTKLNDSGIPINIFTIIFISLSIFLIGIIVELCRKQIFNIIPIGKYVYKLLFIIYSQTINYYICHLR